MTMPIHFEMSFSGSHSALAGHFPGNTMVPGALLLGAMQVMLARYLDDPVCAITKLRFNRPLPPDQVLEVSLDSAGERAYRLRMLVGRETVLKCLVHCRVEKKKP
jgi:3-hydroxymyristoyl/3-hydroxydecanoyl-(acyl carrier protein) dehydratase